MTWQAQFQRLEAQRRTLIAELQTASDEALSQQPEPGHWSAKQVLEHILLAEAGSLKYLEYKRKQDEPLPKADVGVAWREGLLMISLYQPFLTFPAPPPVSQPRNDRTLTEVSAAWTALRMQLELLLTDLPPEWHRTPSYRHVRAGRISLMGMLHFFEAHVARHRRQIRRCLKA